MSTQFRRGDLFSEWDRADLLLVTTNSVVSPDGALVMGAGAARAARDRFPGIQYPLGKAVASIKGDYGLIISPSWPAKKLGILQTKRHHRDPSDLELIKFSLSLLKIWMHNHPTAKVHMNFPGIGYGQLDRNAILPLLKGFGPNLTVWEHPHR